MPYMMDRLTGVRCISRITCQCAGIFPNHSTPESFIGTLGSNPFVTAWVMRACLFSWSSSISRSFFWMSWSMAAVLRSRKRRCRVARLVAGSGSV